MKNIKYSFAFTFLLLFAIGCGGNVTVTGKVVFPDGTPLDKGEVLFETPAMLAKGTIQADGTYTLSTGAEKGIPKGTYKISIGGFQPTIIPAPVGPGGMQGAPKIIPPVIPIAQKYLNSETSGLICEVKGRTKYDITVEKP